MRSGDRAIHIVLADEHQAVRKGMISLLEAQGKYKVIGEANHGRQTIDCVSRFQNQRHLKG